MGPLMRPQAEMLADLLRVKEGGDLKVVDISASHGLYGIAILTANPRARAVAIDWAAVLEVARENATLAGVADRLRTVPGDAFQVDLGSANDLVLIPNFLHHFDARTCEGFLRKVHAALRPGGRAAIVEFIPEDDRISPPPAALFSLTMLTNTPAGDAYTYPEIESMLKNAGFSRAQLHPLPPTSQSAVIAEK